MKAKPEKTNTKPEKTKKKKVKDEEFAVSRGRGKRTEASAQRRLNRKKDRLEKAMDGLDIESIKVAPGEKEYADEYVHVFKRLAKLIRKYEKRALKGNSSRDVYALSMLISQQREVISDLRIMQDASSQMDQVVNSVLQPLIQNVAQLLLDGFYQLRKLVSETVPDKERKFALRQLENIARDQSKAIQMHYENSIEQTRACLIGVANESQKPKKRKK